MTHALVIFVAAVLTNNILLSNFLGMCSFIVCSRQVGTALGLGAAVTFVLACTAPINYLIYHLVLSNPHLDLVHLHLVVFIAVIAGFVQLVEMVIERFSPTLHHALGIFLPLITVNCAILGASLFMIGRSYTFVQAVGFGFGSGVGWTLAITLMAGIRQKLLYAHCPKALDGIGIVMIIVGIMAMAFFGFSGMVSIQ